MSRNKKKTSIWERYIIREIGIEFKACLYFFCILFFYSVYRLANGRWEANIIHMAEMILLTYAMGYFQVYFLSNFDEGEHFGVREMVYTFLCSVIYTGVSFLGKWFDGNVAVSIGFACFVMFEYVCAFLVYKSKREIDGKQLNNDLRDFQERRKNEQCDSDQ